MVDNPQVAHAATAVSATFALGAWVEPFELWVRIVAGLVAIAAGLFSIWTNARKK